jgi:hypothetical protein
VLHAVEHQAHERFALEYDAAVHWLSATSGLLHKNTDNAVSPGPACIIHLSDEDSTMHMWHSQS